MFLKTLYIVAIGLLFAAFVGLGFDAFYTAPKAPEYPDTLMTVKTAEEMTLAERQQRNNDEKTFRDQQKSYEATFKTYNRNLSIGLVVTAVVILVISILGFGKVEILGDGLTLGGVFTLFYGLIRSFMAEDPKIRFLAVAIGLVVLGFLSWWKFVKPSKSTPTGI